MKARGINRRQFIIKAAHTSAAAIGFPYLVASSAMGEAGAVSPSNRIVLGAIGVGGQGTRHVGGGIWVQGGGFLSKPEVQFVAVCDVNANNRNRCRDIDRTDTAGS